MGLSVYGEIEDIQSYRHDDAEYVRLKVDVWRNTKHVIRPVKYGIATYMMTTLTLLNEAKELPELYMKNKQETTLWKMLRRISDHIKVDLDQRDLDEASRIETFTFKDITIQMNKSERTLMIQNGRDERTLHMNTLVDHPSMVFKEILRFL